MIPFLSCILPCLNQLQQPAEELLLTLMLNRPHNSICAASIRSSLNNSKMIDSCTSL